MGLFDFLKKEKSKSDVVSDDNVVGNRTHPSMSTESHDPAHEEHDAAACVCCKS